MTNAPAWDGVLPRWGARPEVSARTGWSRSVQLLVSEPDYRHTGNDEHQLLDAGPEIDPPVHTGDQVP